MQKHRHVSTQIDNRKLPDIFVSFSPWHNNTVSYFYGEILWIPREQIYWMAKKHSAFLTAFCQHTDSYKYGVPHQVEDVWEGLCDVLSL